MSGSSRAKGAAAVAAAGVPLRIVRAGALKASPWKNGAGVTREIAAYPVGASLDTFVWRVSVAEVVQPGPFSRFPGVDRTLVLLSGAGLRLEQSGGATQTLAAPLSVARFEGEAAVDAQLLDGATRDFNLMVRRAHARAELQVWDGAGRHLLDADSALIFCARGSLDVRLKNLSESGGCHVPPQGSLAALDTLVLDAPRALACDLSGDGAALAVLVRYS